ncbi:MAG: hypothetical protein J5953_08790 [Prevotella sp.]|nr:hypothetical protein [Prevotella sp.]
MKESVKLKVKSEEFAAAQQDSTQQKSTRRKLQKSFKSNTRIYDDGSIEVDPQAQGEPSQKDVKKVGKSKRYITSGKNPLTCIELKCPEEVADKAAFFQKELAKLTKDIQIGEPQMPDDEYLVDKPNLKVCFAQKEGKVMAWLTFDVKGLLEVRRELYSLTSEIDKCFVINSDSICPQQ